MDDGAAPPDVNPEAVALRADVLRLLRALPGIEALVAAGLVGSVARGTAGPRSDIDVFLVFPDGTPPDADAPWFRRVNEALDPLRRPVSVIPYTPRAIRKIADWYVLRLASDAVFAHDTNGEIAALLKRVVAKAKVSGFDEVMVGGRPCWKWLGPPGVVWNLELDG